MFPLTSSGLLVSIIIIIGTILLLKALLAGAAGPWGLPIIGYYPFLGSDIHIKLSNLAKKYGDVFVLNFGGQEYVHLNSYKALKEAHVTKAECFSSRCHKYSPVLVVFGNGVAFAEDEKWRVLRKFLVQGMRHFGIGGNTENFSGPALDSVNSFLEELRKNDGEVVDLMTVLNSWCRAAVHRIFLGDTVDDNYGKLIAEVYEGACGGLTGKNMLLSGSFAKYFVFPMKKELRCMKSYKKKLDSMLQKIIDDHRATIDRDNPRDFIDLYLNENKTRETKKDPHALFFTDDALIDTLVQVFGDGSFGVAFCVAAFLKKLSFLPEVQKSINEEIMDVMGPERMPAWDDRKNLPYTMAVIKELLRTSDFNPISPSLECTKDTTVMGVPISKGQVTLVNMYSIHSDSLTYKDPEKFDPNRFLNDSSLQTAIFGIGKRACAGESMVMLQVFAYIASVCQWFTFTSEETTQKSIANVADISHCKVKVFLRKSADCAEE